MIDLKKLEDINFFMNNLGSIDIEWCLPPKGTKNLQKKILDEITP